MKVSLNDFVAKKRSKGRGKNRKLLLNHKRQPQVLVDQIPTHKSHKKPHWENTEERETNQTPRLKWK